MNIINRIRIKLGLKKHNRIPCSFVVFHFTSAELAAQFLNNYKYNNEKLPNEVRLMKAGEKLGIKKSCY